MNFLVLGILVIIIFICFRNLRSSSRREKKINECHERRINLEERILTDVMKKTGFDLSGAKFMFFIDYSTQQLAGEEAYYLASDISPFLQQARMLNFEIKKTCYSQSQLDIIARLLKKSKRNNRPSIVTYNNESYINKLSYIDKDDCQKFDSYNLSQRGGDEFHHGDISVSILPELSLIVVERFSE